MRQYLAEALSKYLQILVELETKQEDYRPDTDAYRNLSGSILHCEGRIEQIRATLKHLDKEETIEEVEKCKDDCSGVMLPEHDCPCGAWGRRNESMR